MTRTPLASHLDRALDRLSFWPVFALFAGFLVAWGVFR